MTFETEWAEVKQEASVRMNLAGAHEPGMPDSGSRGPSGRLLFSKEAWDAASGAVGEVATGMRTALGEFERKQEGAGTGGKGGGGLLSSAALTALTATWRRKADLVGRESGELEDKLAKAADGYYKTEQGIEGAFKEQRTQPVQEPAGRPARGEQGTSRW